MTYFVYRTHYEGPLGKRIRRLPDATVLGWFRRAWAAVVDDVLEDADAWIEAELGGGVYGLASFFERVRDRRIPAPESWEGLRDLLREHLYVEGGLRVDAHSVRVRTDDDEVELPYFFFDDALAAAYPDRVAYLLHEAWPLPDDAVAVSRPSPGEAVRVWPSPAGPPSAGCPAGAVPDGGGAGAGGTGTTHAGTTHAVLLTFYDSDSICWQPPFSFPGVRLPELAAHLRTTTGGLERWPHELLVLRALVAPGDDGIGPALDRCNRWPSFGERTPDELLGGHSVAHAFALRNLDVEKYDNGRDPDRTLLRDGGHLAQMSVHMDEFFGHQQWFLFDDVWAGRHGDLARSLLHYATDWDPFAPAAR
ncbi:hypothetical protein [Streptosporangium fragile]|uniref:hypothetical protein n=1 Tax=Streptosporangium fragile TaxID=46186 RepID=UPI0031E959A5